MSEQLWVCRDRDTACPSNCYRVRPFPSGGLFVSADGTIQFMPRECPKEKRMDNVVCIPCTIGIGPAKGKSNTVHYDGQHWQEEKPMPDYEIVKPVSIKALIQAQGDVKCEEFWKELAAFSDYIDGQGGNLHLTWDYWETAKDYIKDHPKAAAFLKEKGFIREKKDPTYHVGQHFSNGSDEYVLACVIGGNIKGRVCMVNIKTGNRWSSVAIVENCEFIKASEIRPMLSGLELISE